MELDIEGVSELLMVPEGTIHRWIRSRGLPAYRVNDEYRFTMVDLMEWATAEGIRYTMNTPAGAAARPAEGRPSLGESLAAGGIHYAVGGRDKAEAIREVVRRLRLPEGADRENLYRIILAREDLGSTAVGDGIAIPHPRNPMVYDVPRTSITLCFLEQPIEFGAADHKPVFALLTLISPTIDAHLHQVSRLSAALLDPGFHQAVVRRAAPQEILAEAHRLDAQSALAARP